MTSSPGPNIGQGRGHLQRPVHEWVSSAFRQPVRRSSRSWHCSVKLPSPAN